MGNQKMGFEGRIYYGTAGSQASTLIENATDISEDFDFDEGSTTVRGDSTVAPVETGDVTVRKYSLEWTMVNDSTDTVLEALRVAAVAGTVVAIRGKDYAAGKGFDGDCKIKFKHGKPLKGEQTIQFTATPSRSAGRAPQLYV